MKPCFSQNTQTITGEYQTRKLSEVEKDLLRDEGIEYQTKQIRTDQNILVEVYVFDHENYLRLLNIGWFDHDY